MPDSIKVGVLTEPGGPHLDIYLDCLANCTGVAEVSVADSGGEIFSLAKTTLGRRFAEVPTYTDYRTLFRERQPDLVVVSFESDHSPAPIQAALDANCHVLAEKPACVRAEDFARLNAIAELHHRYLMLAPYRSRSQRTEDLRLFVRGTPVARFVNNRRTPQRLRSLFETRPHDIS